MDLQMFFVGINYMGGILRIIMTVVVILACIKYLRKN
mgnify:CR=1 FL=1